MLKFAANLSYLYSEVDFLERFRLAAEDGFQGVEYLFPYGYSASQIRSLLDVYGLEQVLFNCVPGDWDAGERGLAALPGRQTECLDGVKRAIDYALQLNCSRLHLMAGIMPAEIELERIEQHYLQTLQLAAQLCQTEGISLLIEPINRRSMPDYFLHRQAQAHAYLDVLQQPNLRVQMDLFHCYHSEGEVNALLSQYLPTGRVGHMQIAGCPDRHEPDQGVLDYDQVFAEIERVDYKAWIGCEYLPSTTTREGLQWFTRYRQQNLAR